MMSKTIELAILVTAFINVDYKKVVILRLISSYNHVANTDLANRWLTICEPIFWGKMYKFYLRAATLPCRRYELIMA